MIKTACFTIGALVVGLLLGASIGSKGENLGSVYNLTAQTFPGLTVADGNATTSVDLGKVCMSVRQNNGTTYFWTVSNTGNLATSTSNCNR